MDKAATDSYNPGYIVQPPRQDGDNLTADQRTVNGTSAPPYSEDIQTKETNLDEEANFVEVQDPAEQPSRWKNMKPNRLRHVGCCLFMLLILLGFGVVVAICFGITVGVEKGLTGSFFWSPGHSQLFRICETSNTEPSIFAVHTCNVFSPHHPVDAPPIHSFTEMQRSWTSYTHRIFGANETARSSAAMRVDPWTLPELLYSRGLTCSRPAGAAAKPAGKAQVIIGKVGQQFSLTGRRGAVACNYDQDGKNLQKWCGNYGDGGTLAVARARPLSINEIFNRHFGMNCSWIGPL